MRNKINHLLSALSCFISLCSRAAPVRGPAGNHLRDVHHSQAGPHPAGQEAEGRVHEDATRKEGGDQGDAREGATASDRARIRRRRTR